MAELGYLSTASYDTRSAFRTVLYNDTTIQGYIMDGELAREAVIGRLAQSKKYCNPRYAAAEILAAALGDESRHGVGGTEALERQISISF